MRYCEPERRTRQAGGSKQDTIPVFETRGTGAGMNQHRPRNPERQTFAVTYIRLIEVNPGKLAALDALAPIFLSLCQQYVTLFCTDEYPDKFHPPIFATPLSERWHRAAIQQAAGIAQSWRTNRAQAYQDYVDELVEYQEEQAESTLDTETQAPTWSEWDVPTLHQVCIQANANVVTLERSEDSTFDYWLKISTLEFRKQLLVPVKLAEYHRKVLEGKAINTSVTLNKRDSGWWLTLSYDEVITVQTEPTAPVVGVDVRDRQFLNHQYRQALWHLSRQTARTAEAGPREATTQSQAPQVPGKERCTEATFYQQQEWAASYPACASGN